MLRSVADAKQFGHAGFAVRYAELRTFAAKILQTVEGDREKFSPGRAILFSSRHPRARGGSCLKASRKLYNRKAPSHYLTINNLVCVRQRKPTVLVGRCSLSPTQNALIVRLACLFKGSLLFRGFFSRSPARLSFFGHSLRLRKMLRVAATAVKSAIKTQAHQSHCLPVLD